MSRKLLSWDCENYIFPKVTKMGSIFGHRIDCNGVGEASGTYPAKINTSNCPHRLVLTFSLLMSGHSWDLKGLKANKARPHRLPRLDDVLQNESCKIAVFA